MPKVIDFVAKKQERESSESKVFCVALAGHDAENLAYGSLYVFPDETQREFYQNKLVNLVAEEEWRKRLALAGMPHSELKPPRLLGLDRELILQGSIQDYNSEDPSYEVIFVLDFISEIERRTNATRLDKDDYFELFEDK